MNNRIIIAVVAVVALLAGFWAARFLTTPELVPPAGDIAPATENTATTGTSSILVDFELPDTDGKLRKLSDWKGKTIVLNFWATWCPPCREEIPLFVDTQEKYKHDGLIIVGVAVDNAQDVKQFVDSYFINYPVLINDQENTKLMASYGNRLAALPYSVIIDRDGKIVSRRSGSFHKSDLEKALAGILSKS